jgi:hypothetical protein
VERFNNELTCEERRALEQEVFPKLCHSHWIVRFLKLVIPSLVLVLSCAAANQQAVSTAVPSQNYFSANNFQQETKETLAKAASAEAFEASMPESQILLASITEFTKKKTC